MLSLISEGSSQPLCKQWSPGRPFKLDSQILCAQDHLKGEQKGQTSITWGSVSLPDLAFTVIRLFSPLFAVTETAMALPAVNRYTHCKPGPFMDAVHRLMGY